MIMNSIIDNQWSILLSVQGTNIWSGQQPQQYNSQAVAWGGLYGNPEHHALKVVAKHTIKGKADIIYVRRLRTLLF